jgi:hypothetical protein
MKSTDPLPRILNKSFNEILNVQLFIKLTTNSNQNITYFLKN